MFLWLLIIYEGSFFRVDISTLFNQRTLQLPFAIVAFDFQSSRRGKVWDARVVGPFDHPINKIALKTCNVSILIPSMADYYFQLQKVFDSETYYNFAKVLFCCWKSLGLHQLQALQIVFAKRNNYRNNRKSDQKLNII